ncbi:MFS transporter [Arthrobacter sp. CJ23]|uniref:MFS transporter n=1 Tax=Arthrobacter sp. CJ23 TaxID=2972479 RepID=UPI00215D0A98|nr:MFS transporter [Arthrobacter sp. CJ23]UVJ38432.1 MFS transporter [Arthrobacter sp. CJ23]
MGKDVSPVSGTPIRLSGLERATSLWRDSNFLRFWSGQAASQFGTQLGQLVFAVLAVDLLSATEFEVGALGASALAAFLVIGLPAGAWVDRWLKRRTMIAADLIRMAAIASLPLLWWSGTLQIWHLFVVSAVLGAATVFFDVAYQSYIPVLVPAANVPQANSKLEATAQIARIGGPAAGGGLLLLVSAPLILAGEALGYLFSALFLLATKDGERRAPVQERRPLAHEVREGLSFVFRHPLISRIVVCTAGVNFFTTLALTLFPVLVLRTLDLGAHNMGVIMAVGAAGGLVGAVSAPKVAAWLGEGTVIPLGSLLSAVFLALVPLSVFAPSQLAAAVMLVIAEFGFGFGVLIYNIMQLSMRQRVCPPRLLGRMNASIRFVVWGVMPLAALASGVLGSWLGVTTTMWIGVAGSLACCAPVWFSPLRRMKKLPDAPEAD